MNKWILTDGSTSLQFYPELGIIDDVKRNVSSFRSRGGTLYQYLHESHKEWKVPLNYVNSSFRSIVDDWFENGDYLSFTPGYTTDVTTVSIIGNESPFRKLAVPYDDQWNGTIMLSEQSAPLWPLGSTYERTLKSNISILDRIYRVAYQQWYAGGELGVSGQVRASVDGVTWAKVGATLSNNVYRIGNDSTGFLVAVCQGGFLYTSDDSGENWTSRTSSFGTDHLRGVDHDHSSTWVIVGILGKIASSSDGISWTQRTNPFGSGVTLDAVAHNKSDLWVAVGSSKLGSSADGITWTLRTITGVSGSMRDVDYNGSIWMAVGSQNIFTSSDGVTWAKQTIPAELGSENIWSISNTKGVWVAGCTSGVIIKSTDDGATWSSISNPASSNVTYLAASCNDNGVCILAGRESSNPYAARSVDKGDTWVVASTGFATGDQIRAVNWAI